MFHDDIEDHDSDVVVGFDRRQRLACRIGMQEEQWMAIDRDVLQRKAVVVDFRIVVDNQDFPRAVRSALIGVSRGFRSSTMCRSSLVCASLIVIVGRNVLTVRIVVWRRCVLMLGDGGAEGHFKRKCRAGANLAVDPDLSAEHRGDDVVRCCR